MRITVWRPCGVAGCGLDGCDGVVLFVLCDSVCVMVGVVPLWAQTVVGTGTCLGASWCPYNGVLITGTST
mgnify:CR=1 FL=1